ncbi:sensor domain-containing protein [Xylophilus sp. ASV27]|uniref:sensor domain-containing protein n=1 Tax=Xylophilus sp. ASV27 TaxID=2795129 RepID=UPI0018EC66E1|nr:diguanylate cyclase [Xylophilus sp. ASV27]
MKKISDALLPTVLDLLLDAVCVVDAQGFFVFVSAAGERIFGYPPHEMVGQPMLGFVYAEDRARTLQAVDEILAGTHQPHFENRYLRKDGRVAHIMWSAHWSEAQQLRVAVARDVTQRRRDESMRSALYAISEAAHSAGDLLALFERIHRVIGGLLTTANFFIALHDGTTGELTVPYRAHEGDTAPGPRQPQADALCAQVIRSGQALLLTPGGTAAPGQSLQSGPADDLPNWLGVPLKGQQGTIGALVVQSGAGVARYTGGDVELLQFVSLQVAAAIERKQSEARLRHAACHDPLTDLPNRSVLHERLQAALVQARQNGARLSLLYLDLDRFKPVNDRLGHAAGDLLLQQAARRLQRCLRESDTVGRIGGDEFLVLLVGLHRMEQALQVAEKIRAALGEPFDLAGEPVRISPSIGMALYPEHGVDERQLMLQADQAMYQAKRQGGNRVQLAAPAVPAIS